VRAVGGDRRDVADGLADGAERDVGDVGQRLDGRRLLGSGDHQGAGPGAAQVGGDLGGGGMWFAGVEQPEFAGERAGEALQFGRMQRKAPVGAGAGEAGGGLDAVEAGQGAVLPAAAASQGIVVGIADLARVPGPARRRQRSR
jgi:hypothetical protein